MKTFTMNNKYKSDYVTLHDRAWRGSGSGLWVSNRQRRGIS